MSVSGIASSSLVDYSRQNVQNRMKQFQQVFQQLGKDLQSGNVSSAQTDFATLQQSRTHATATTSAHSHNQIAQDFQQLAKDLQSGNISAAQKDYATVQQDFQNHPSQTQRRTNTVTKLLGTLGRMVQSGAIVGSHLLGPLGIALRSSNLLASGRASTTVQQAMQQFAQNSSLQTQLSSQPGANGISIDV